MQESWLGWFGDGPQSESLPSWLWLADLQYVDGPGELAGVPGAAADESMPTTEASSSKVTSAPTRRGSVVGSGSITVTAGLRSQLLRRH